eukprot:7057725-Prymnesium_polylepis.2
MGLLLNADGACSGRRGAVQVVGVRVVIVRVVIVWIVIVRDMGMRVVRVRVVRVRTVIVRDMGMRVVRVLRYALHAAAAPPHLARSARVAAECLLCPRGPIPVPEEGYGAARGGKPAHAMAGGATAR